MLSASSWDAARSRGNWIGLDWIGLDGRPAAVKNFLADTLRRLGRVDPVVPIEETIVGIADMVKAAGLLSLKNGTRNEADS